jgi:hypothetical protein
VTIESIFAQAISIERLFFHTELKRSTHKRENECKHGSVAGSSCFISPCNFDPGLEGEGRPCVTRSTLILAMR